MDRLIMKTKEEEAEEVYYDAYRNFHDYLSDHDMLDLIRKEWAIRIAHNKDGERYSEEHKKADSVLLWATLAETVAEREKQSFLETSE